MLEKASNFFELFLDFLFILSILMMGISIAMIIVMIVRDNRYNEIQEIQENDLEINYNNDPLISDDIPVSVLDKNSDKKLIYKKNSDDKNTPSTGAFTLNEPIRNLYGNEYIELNSNENELENFGGRLDSESEGRKKSIEI